MTRTERNAKRNTPSGFGLIELLVVLGILSVVMAAIGSLYRTHQRSATTEQEVVDVQQNLRIGLEQVSRDIAMAGFMIGNTNPVAATVDGGGVGVPDALALNTGAESLVAATINTSIPSLVVVAGTIVDLPVLTYGGSVGGFESVADENISQTRIVNYRGEPLGAGTTFTVLEVRAAVGACGAVPAPCIRLRANGPGTGPVSRGDSIVRTSVAGGAEAFPHVVQYALAPCPPPTPGQCLMRNTVPAAAGGADVVATNVTDVQFRYLLAGNLEVDAPTPSQIDSIRAIRVTLSGQIINALPISGGSPKTRTVMSVVAIRNT